jgi:GNAT superfamily N-acetyltransferase
MSGGVDSSLIEAWLRARSVSRGLPQPVADRGGLRVETGLPQETRRYLFVSPCEGLREIADSVREPRIFLKLCDTAHIMRNFIPPCWQVSPSNFMMICEEGFRCSGGAGQLPSGYRLELNANSTVTHVRVLSANGEIAASGYAVEHGGVFVYDRILTAEVHRRRGLGRAVMTALASARRSPSAQQILAATHAGHELYRTLGWTDYAPYTTAVIPDPPGANGSATWRSAPGSNPAHGSWAGNAAPPPVLANCVVPSSLSFSE